MRNIKLTIEYDGKEFRWLAEAAKQTKYSRRDRTGNTKNYR